MNRPTNREGKRLNIFLLRLVHAFMLFRQKQKDKNSQLIIEKFSELELKWFDACKMNCWKIKPKKTAFAYEVNSLIIKENLIINKMN